MMFSLFIVTQMIVVNPEMLFSFFVVYGLSKLGDWHCLHSTKNFTPSKDGKSESTRLGKLLWWNHIFNTEASDATSQTSTNSYSYQKGTPDYVMMSKPQVDQFGVFYYLQRRHGSLHCFFLFFWKEVHMMPGIYWWQIRHAQRLQL